MKERLNYLLFSLISSALFDKEMSEEDKLFAREVSFEEITQIAEKHDLAHLVAFALLNNNLIKEEDKLKAEKLVFKAVYRFEKLSFEYERVCEAFEEAEIAFLPLKGAVIRTYYPEPWMRTSCDIDILVKNEELEKAKTLLVAQYGYQVFKQGAYDVELRSPNDVPVELHFSLFEEEHPGKYDEVLLNVWDNACPADGKKYQYKLLDEYFYYHHIVHMAKHFLIGGCGIRPLLDLYILNHNIPANREGRSRLLEEGGALKFAEEMELVSEVWFGEKSHTGLTKNIEAFIISGGVYGSQENGIAVSQIKKGNNFRYIAARIWAPYREMKLQYPILGKYKWLLPVYEIRRWSRLVFCNRLTDSVQELKTSSHISKDKTAETKELLEQLEL